MYKQKGTQNNNWRGGKTPFPCMECGLVFLAYSSERKRGGAKFCSVECGYENKRNRINIICGYCGKEFETHKYYVERGSGKYCSTDCFSGWFSENKSGENSHLFGTKQSSGHIAKRIKWGSENCNWKGGITPENHKIRNGKKIQDWRKCVFDRDEYRCIRCGDGGYLHAHHILSFSSYPEERFADDNGITWCVPCHYDWHSKPIALMGGA